MLYRFHVLLLIGVLFFVAGCVLEEKMELDDVDKDKEHPYLSYVVSEADDSILIEIEAPNPGYETDVTDVYAREVEDKKVIFIEYYMKSSDGVYPQVIDERHYNRGLPTTDFDFVNIERVSKP